MDAANIFHDSVECGVFSSRLFRAGEIVNNYYEALDFSNLKTQKQVWNSYGDDAVSVIVDNISTQSFKTTKTFSDHTEKERSRIIMPAGFIVCDFLPAFAAFPETISRQFNVVRNHEKTTYLLCKCHFLTARQTKGLSHIRSWRTLNIEKAV